MATRHIARRAGVRLLALGALLLAVPVQAHTQFDTIRDVNWQVNALPLSDCKSFSWEKQRRLLNRGIDAKWVVVKTETGSAHAITVVDAKWALDNRFKGVTTVQALRDYGYQIAHLPGEP